MKSKSLSIRNVSRLFLCFMSSVFLLVFSVLLVLRLTIFSPNFFMNQVNNSGFTQALANETNQNITQQLRGYNIPPELIENLVSAETVSAELEERIHSAYAGGELNSVKTADVKAELTSRLNDYLASNPNMSADAGVVEEVSGIAGDIFDRMTAMPLIRTFASMLLRFGNLILITMVASGVLWAVLSLIIFMMLRKYLHRLLRYVAYASLGAGFMTLVAPAYLLSLRLVERANTQSEAMYSLLTSYTNNLLYTFVTIGGIFIGLGIILAVTSEVLSKKVRAKIRQEKEEAIDANYHFAN